MPVSIWRQRCLVVGGYVFGTMLRVVPRRFRLRTCAHLAVRCAPLLHRLDTVTAYVQLGLDTAREVVLFQMLKQLTRDGVSFTVEIEGPGLEPLGRHLSAGRGMLLVGTHALMTPAFLRFVNDRGARPTVIANAPVCRIPGTSESLVCLQPGPFYLVKVRRILKQGGVVCAVIDRANPVPHRSRDFSTGRGAMHVCDPLLRVAQYSGADVFFGAVRLDASARLVGFVEKASMSATDGPDALIEQYGAFARRQMAYAAAG